MAIRTDPDDYQRSHLRTQRPESSSDEDDYGPLPSLNDTLIELAVTIAGFIVVLIAIFAAVRAFQ